MTQHFRQSTTYLNVDTGAVLTDVVRGKSTFVERTAKFVGVSTSVRDSTGKLVMHHAGQVVVDLNTFDVVKATPNWFVAFEDLCRALGGNPA